MVTAGLHVPITVHALSYSLESLALASLVRLAAYNPVNNSPGHRISAHGDARHLAALPCASLQEGVLLCYSTCAQMVERKVALV